jgi:Uma2 family endonuclease
MSAIPKPRVELEPLAPVQDPQRLVLDNISWDTYVTIADALDERNIHLTYDRGRLEFMTLSPEHERYKRLLGRLVDVMGEEFDIAIGGSAP